MKPELILVGGGGHCKACIDVIELEAKYRIAGIVDLPERIHQKVLGYEIMSGDDDLPRLAKDYQYFLVTVGQIKSPAIRVRLYKKLKEYGAVLPVIKSPLAYISAHAEIGEGTIIMHHALVNAGAKVGRNCIINSKVLIEHDALVGNNCHIATGAAINGGVKVGPETFFGSNAVTREYIEIGENSIIGCGAKIIKNAPPNSSIFNL